MPEAGHDAVVVIGVRHHSPACARVVADTIAQLRPTHVLIEGPADYNNRLGELNREHRLPIALFSHERNGTRTRVTWTAFADFSPEWVALRAASASGTDVRFIDLPSWHPEFDSEPAEYGPAVTAAVKKLGLDTVDAMWDHVTEARAQALTTAEMTEVLDAYFDAARSNDTVVSARERYMTSWARAARAQPGSGPVVVVCGGLHRPAIISELASAAPSDGTWPTVPIAHPGLDVGSYLIPYSYRRLEVESPGWYEKLWQEPVSAAEIAIEAIVRDLRAERHQISTTDFIGFRAQVHALAAMRGHPAPTRRDILDAAASTLVEEALASPLPWTLAGEPSGTAPNPVITSCLRTLRGDRRGELHPDSPAPGLVHHVGMLLETFDLAAGTLSLDLTDERGRSRSRVLHQLRMLEIPGFDRLTGPTTGSEVLAGEEWVITESDTRIAALTEAAALGHTLVEASGATLETALRSAGVDATAIAQILFDAVLCGLDNLSDNSASAAVESIDSSTDVAGVGLLLRAALDLWRHDSLFGSRGSTMLAAVIASASTKVLSLAGRARITAGGADRPRIAAIAALADALRYAGQLLTADPRAELVSLARDTGAAVDMRGSALGTLWNRSTPEQAVAAVRSIPPDRLGDWLCGLFGVARERFLEAEASDSVLAAVDDVVSGMTEHDFLTALPALRQSFEFFPPRERGVIAARLNVDAEVPVVVATLGAGQMLDERIDEMLERIGLR